MEKKLAVIFPGVGYHVDKPLLYYGRKMAVELGYEVYSVDYGTLPGGIKGDPERMREAYRMARTRAEEQLEKMDFGKYDRVLFLSKSLGTAVAAACDVKFGLGAGQVIYTPVEETFRQLGAEGIVFHGTADNWADTDAIRAACEARKMPLFLTEGANHSMETGDCIHDLGILMKIMGETKQYIQAYDKGCEEGGKKYGDKIEK